MSGKVIGDNDVETELISCSRSFLDLTGFEIVNFSHTSALNRVNVIKVTRCYPLFELI